MKKSYILASTLKLILLTLYPAKVLGITLETDSRIKYVGTFQNNIKQTGTMEISFKRWNGTNGSAVFKAGLAVAKLKVSATGNNTLKMLGTLEHQQNSWSVEVNCLKSNADIPSLNCSYRMTPIKADIYNQTITGNFEASRHVYDCLGGLPYGIDDFKVPPPTWCGFYPY